MTAAADLLASLESRGVLLSHAPNGDLRIRPVSALTPVELAEVKALKPEILGLLTRRNFAGGAGQWPHELTGGRMRARTHLQHLRSLGVTVTRGQGPQIYLEPAGLVTNEVLSFADRHEVTLLRQLDIEERPDRAGGVGTVVLRGSGYWKRRAAHGENRGATVRECAEGGKRAQRTETAFRAAPEKWPRADQENTEGRRTGHGRECAASG